MANLAQFLELSTDAGPVVGVGIFGGLILVPRSALKSRRVSFGGIAAKADFDDETLGLVALWPTDPQRCDEWVELVDRVSIDVADPEVGSQLWLLEPSGLRVGVFAFDRSRDFISFSVPGDFAPRIGSLVVDGSGRLVAIITESELQIGRGPAIAALPFVGGLLNAW